MKNKLPRKYRIISKVHHSDYLPLSINSFFSRFVPAPFSPSPPNNPSPTPRPWGCGGGGAAPLSKPRAAFAHTVCSYTWEPAKGGRPLLRHPATRMCALHSNCHLAGWTQSTLTPWKPAKDERPPLRHPAAVSLRTKKSRCLAGSQTKKRHKLRLTCVFVMQKNKSSHIEINKKGE